jgi:DNA-binding PadR family transcriptional regulator
VTETGSDCASDIDETDLEGVHADLSALCRDILLIIGQLERSSVAEPVGVAIREHLQNDYNRKVSNNVYNRLTDLADRGLIQKTPYVAQKKRYVLTETGQAVLEAYATQVVNDLAMFADGV